VEHLRYHRGALHCEEVPLADLAERAGTPLYVYSSAAVVERCRAVESAFGGRPHLTCYAVKANSNRHLLRLIAAEGLGADVNSVGEMAMALDAGFAPSMITFSGVGKRDDEIAFGLEHDILAFNAESEQELDVLDAIAARAGRRARVLVRVNLDIDAGGHAYISTSLKQNKFGVSRENVLAALRRASTLPHLELRGIHSHIGSQILKAATFRSAASALAGLVGEVRRAGMPVHEVDFGGGFGVQYQGALASPGLPDEPALRPDFSFASVLPEVMDILAPAGVAVSFQPGRSIVAEAGVLLTRVLYRKESGGKTFLVVDGGMNDLLRPSLYNAYHQIVPVRLDGAAAEEVDVVGPLCESGDFFAKGRKLPRSVRGDLLALLGAGAYGYVLASNYNARPRGAEVLVDGASWRVIRERERIEDL